MSFTAAIDISTFIWCEQDFNENKNQYIALKSLVPNVYAKIKQLKLPVLFRENLQQLIWTEFPYKMMEQKEIGYDFQRLTFEFFIDTFSNWTLYIENNDNTITSIPSLKKPHFTDNILRETQSQVCHLFYNGKEPQYKFIVYMYFFNQNKNLILSRQDDNVEIRTLCYNSEEEIIKFFENYSLRFEHNNKHRNYCYYDYERNEIVSPFSSYHNHGEGEAQKLLDQAFPFNGHFYNFDLKNDVYVRFINTRELIYHGHDISDEGENVPKKIKKKFSKNGKKFHPENW